MGKETNNAATPEQAPVPKSALAAAPVAAMTSTGAHASAETAGLESPVSAVAGVGSARARLLAKRGILTVGDLLLDAPTYENRRSPRSRHSPRRHGAPPSIFYKSAVWQSKGGCQQRLKPSR